MSLARSASCFLAIYLLSLLFSQLCLAQQNEQERNEHAKQNEHQHAAQGSQNVGVHAEDYQHAVQEQPNSGAHTEGHQAQEEHFRINRDYSPHLYHGAVEQQHQLHIERRYIPVQAAPQPVVQTVTTFTPPPPCLSPARGYIWEQSAVGGYYDATGQNKQIIMGDQLYLYGGTFADGTPVPTTPVVCNFAGHVYMPYVVKRM